MLCLHWANQSGYAHGHLLWGTTPFKCQHLTPTRIWGKKSYLLHWYFCICVFSNVFGNIKLLWFQTHRSSPRDGQGGGCTGAFLKMFIFLKQHQRTHVKLVSEKQCIHLFWQGQHFPRGSTNPWVVLVSLLWLRLKFWFVALTTHSSVLFVCSL